MAILLLILKIIGITLLVILGLILFLILMVLFYPIGYRVRGEWQEELKVRVTVGWLFSIVHMNAAYEDGETKAVVRFFGIPFVRIPKKEKVRRPKQPKKVKPKEAAEAVNEMIPAESVKPIAEVVLPEPQEDEVLKEAFDSLEKKLLPKEADIEYNREDEFEKSETPNKTGFSERIRDFGEKLRGIGAKIRGIREKLRSIRAQIHEILEMIRDDGNKRVVKLVWKEFVGLMKRYRPRRVKADVDYCMGDPARTGQVLGGLAMLPFLYTQKVSIVPDFESEQFYVKGTWDIKGHIQVFPLLMAGLRIYRNQDVKKLIKQLREREEG